MSKPIKLSLLNGKPTLVPYDAANRKNNDRAYNQRRSANQSKYVTFYKTREWLHTRQQVLTRDYQLCQRCGLEGSLVDHIVPSKDDWEDRLCLDNLQTLCKDCHSIKTKREWIKHHKGAERYMTIKMVCGLPGSGKSTYATKHRTDHDLIYDYDVLMSALSGLPLHERNQDIHDYVMLFYDQLLRKLRAEKTFNSVWIIQTYPDERLDTLLSNYHHVDHILIDTDKQICIERLKKQNRFNENMNSVFNEFSKKDFEKFRRVH
jgi:5-methylcytosine-specific restriction endonuclease McrA/predicted kinase